MRQGTYKSYNRGHRAYSVENTFIKGMKYTDSPLDEGETRLLVNFDLANDRESLMPRPGLQLIPQTMFTEIKQPEGMRLLRVAGNQCFTFGEDHIFANDVRINKSFKLPVTPQVRPVIHLHNISYKTQTQKTLPHTVAFNSDLYFTQSDRIKHFKSDPEGGDDFLHVLEPKKLNPSEAVLYGYNMLLENPYLFKDNVLSGAEGQVQFHGIALYEPETDHILFDPRINQEVKFRAFYSATKGDYFYMFRARAAQHDTYSIVKVGAISVTDVCPELSYTAPIPNDAAFLELMIWNCKKVAAVDNTTETAAQTIYLVRQPDRIPFKKYYWSAVKDQFIPATQREIARDATCLQRIENSFNFTETGEKSLRGMKFENYNLTTSRGLTYWNGSLICYAPEGGENILFASQFNTPEYFPYPQNTDIFEEPIKYCVPYLSDLLVFTSTQLWRLTRNTTGAGWVKALIQGNLHIAEADIPFIQVVKNMVYFKSGDGYFMVVPKSQSTTGELTLAPVSRNMDLFFKDFKASVIDLLELTYGTESPCNGTIKFAEADYKVLEAYSYLDYEDVHNVYRLELTNGSETETVTLELLYNTVVRYWRAYVYQSEHALYPYTEDATKNTDLVTKFGDKLCFVVRSPKKYDDLKVPKYAYKNYQLIDSGQHDYNIEQHKRFRELQFTLNNLSGEDLKFGSAFYLDGQDRYPLYKYSVSALPPQGGYATMYLAKEPILNAEVQGVARLGEWQIGSDLFHGKKLTKIRTQVSGKGYAPRFVLRAVSEKDFALLNYIFTYRLLYAR